MSLNDILDFGADVAIGAVAGAYVAYQAKHGNFASACISAVPIAGVAGLGYTAWRNRQYTIRTPNRHVDGVNHSRNLKPGRIVPDQERYNQDGFRSLGVKGASALIAGLVVYAILP